MSEDLLDFADLGQLITIVLGRWEKFGDLLGTKTRFQVKADEFREWRDRLAHGGNPTTDQKIEIAVLLRQVGQQTPLVVEPAPPGRAIPGAVVLWVDDHPEGNLKERQLLRALGIDVVPVTSNDEALDAVGQRLFDLVISDIERSESESGDKLPARLSAAGMNIPIVFYVGRVDPERDSGRKHLYPSRTRTTCA